MKEKAYKPSDQMYTDKFDHIITKASERHGVSFPLLKAIIKVESNFNPKAVSKKGAKGLMQLMPENIRSLKVKDPFDPVENIMGGAKYIRKLLDRFDGELQLSLAAYNAGPSQVDLYRRIPPLKRPKNIFRKLWPTFTSCEKVKQIVSATKQENCQMKFMPQTIRIQIVTAFLVCFVFMGVIIAINYDNFRRLSRSMQLFEVSEDMNRILLEMRRYEKNYFLYRQQFSYEENVTFTNQLSLILQREQENLYSAIGKRNYDNFLEYLHKYTAQMKQLGESLCDPQRCVQLQEQIRGLGQNMMILADQLVTAERRAINYRLQQMIPLPLIGLLLLVVLLGFVVFFIGEKVIRPLARITRESEAVAKGAFQRITPYGEGRNEIHYLVTAINRMMEELEKRQEQLIQSRKISSIGTLTAGIAHELNNPINNISLTIEALLEDGESMNAEERRRLYEEAMDQADRTSEIVRNLLEFSRASHPKLEYVNLVELVEKTARLLKNEMELSGIRFVKEVRNSVPKIHLDKGGMQQVLLNLFMNAIQAMDDGGELKVVIGPTDTPGELRIDVIDTGHGIAPEDLDQIFDPFFTTKKEGMGTGLGLSVSHNIIRKNGGRIEVQSRLEQGTCFSIFLQSVEKEG